MTIIINQNLDQYPEMTPAINLLPPELLSEILQQVVKGAKAHRDQHVRYLSHVDQHWRSVALDTPQLWTTIVSKTPFDSIYDFERIAVWSERAKAVSLIFVLRDVEKDAAKALVDIFKLIGPTVETILFEPGHYWPLYRILDGTPATLSFPRLQRLASNGTLSLAVIRKHFLGAIPSLNQLSLVLHDLRGIEMVKDLWPWLTTFHGSFLDEQTLSGLFANAPRLRECSFATKIGALQIQPSLRHDALRSLFVRGYSTPTEGFSTHFPSLPNLEHLGIYTPIEDGRISHPFISRLFHSCCATLRYLELFVYDMDITEFTRLLTLAPLIRFLHLSGGVAEGFIKALTFHSESNPILPELEVISLSEIRFTQGPLWELAVSRARVPLADHQSDLPISSSYIMPDIASTVHIWNPPLRRALRYIIMSEKGLTHKHRSRFGFTRVSMQNELGISLEITGSAHHLPRKDAMELLKLSLYEAPKWDWKERVDIWQPTW